MNISANIGKSILLAFVVFWTINFTDDIDFDTDMLGLAILSIIPIGICVTIVIVATICPVFWIFSNKDMDRKKVFKNYFPFYTIVAFSVCAFGIYTFNSEVFIISFLITAYITTAQSWVWFAKQK
ncbi:hypothetical protein [Lacinutrix salivirga]